jgi:hypothetical protein
MARSKPATDAAKSGGDAPDGAADTPSGGEQAARTPAQSTEQYIDFGTGQPTDATPAETGETRPGQDRTPPQPTQQDEPPTPTESGQSQAFSQADLDRIVAERLERERRKYADYETLKEAADELATLKGQQAEDDKLITEKLADLQSQYQATTVELQEARLRTGILSEAAKMGFTDPSDAFNLIDIGSLDVDDDGKVTGVPEALEKLKEQKPYLFARRSPQVEPANAARDQQTGRTDADRRRDYFGHGGKAIWEGGGLVVVEQQ